MNKPAVLLAIALLTLLGIESHAQQSTASPTGSGWTRITTANDELSISFPEQRLVDAEEKKSGQRYFVYAYEGGTELEMKVFADKMAARNLQLVAFEGNAGVRETKLEVSDIIGKSVVRPNSPFEAAFYFASKEYYYIVKARSQTGQTEVVQRFIRSLRIRNKPIVRSTGEVVDDGTISISSLGSSPEILAALTSKSGSASENVEWVTDAKSLGAGTTAPEIRPAIIVSRQYPQLEYKHLQGSRQQGTLVVKLKLQFLASGKIGDITIYSEANREFAKDCIELAKKIKFIPAKKDGRPIDSYQIVTYYFVFAPFELKY